MPKQTSKQPDGLSIRLLKNKPEQTFFVRGDDLLISDYAEQLLPRGRSVRVDDIMIVVCLKGSGWCTVRDSRHEFCADRLLVALPDDSLSLDTEATLSGYVIMLSRSYCDELQIDFRQRCHFIMGIKTEASVALPHEEILALHPYYNLLRRQLLAPSRHAGEIVRGLSRALVYSILTLLQTEWQQRDERHDAERAEQLFDKFQSLLAAHFREQRSVTFYARRLCLTPNYFSGEIKVFSGRSASWWINERVVGEAKILLRDYDLNIQEIAYWLSFPSQSAFGKFLRKKTGISPKAYRQSRD